MQLAPLKHALGAASIVIIAAAIALASETDKTPVISQTDPSKTLSVQNLAFLEGTWRAFKPELVEEIWSKPTNGAIMGCFRWHRPDAGPFMFEILTITDEAEGVILRLRHYSPTLHAKEAADKPVTLRLDQLAGTSARFVAHQDAGSLESITYTVFEPDDSSVPELDIVVAFAGERPPLRFRLRKDR